MHHEPLSGYDIRKRIEGSLSLFWDAGFGQIYPTLKKLAAGGLVEGRSEKTGGRPEKTVFVITEKGRDAIREWLAEPAAREYVRYEILLKLFFGGLTDPGHNIRAIEAFKERYVPLEAMLESYQNELRGIVGQNPDHLYYLLTVMFGRRLYRAYLDWADEALSLIREHADTKEGKGGSSQ